MKPFLICLLLGLLLITARANAEGNCPPGMYPFQFAPDQPPSCAPIPGYQQPAPSYNYDSAPPPVQFAPARPKILAFSVDENGVAGWAYGGTSESDAINSAQASCQKAGGKQCRSLGTSTNCMTFAMDNAGQTFIGNADTMEALEDKDQVAIGAAVRAMQNCNKNSTGGKCRLISTPVCATGFGSEIAAKIPAKELEAISIKLDTRSYWGSITSDGSGISASNDMPNQESAEAKAMKDCGGSKCRVLVSYKDSCASVAWPNNNKPLREIATDADPKAAKSKALTLCSQKYGSCTAAVRCNGAKYAKNNPDAR